MITRSYPIHGHVHISHADLSSYVCLTWFGAGTQEHLCNQNATHPLSRFAPNDDSLIHYLDSSQMTYLRTIELSWGLGQSLGILTRLLVFYDHNFQSPWLGCAVPCNSDKDCQSKVSCLNPSGVHNRYYTGFCQCGFVSSDLWGILSSDPKDCHLFEYDSSMTPPSQCSP